MLLYYQILGLEQNASFQDIRKRYRELVIKYHPDRNKHLQQDGYDEDKFKKIIEAYTILSDSEKRKKYDNDHKFRNFVSPDYKYSFTIPDNWYNLINNFFGKSENNHDNGFTFKKIFTQFIEKNEHYFDNKQNENLESIIKACKFFYQNFQNTKSSPSSSIQKTKQNNNQNNNHHNKHNMIINEKVKHTIINATANLESIYNGIKKQIEVPRKVLCLECKGYGYIGIGRNMSLCDLCRGLMFNHEKIQLEINLAKSETIFYGHGDQGIERISGNIIIKIHPKEHQYKIINNYDLLLVISVELEKLYVGGQKIITLPNGLEYKVDIIPSSELRKTKQIIIHNYGLLIEESERRGDLYLNIDLILPETLGI